VGQFPADLFDGRSHSLGDAAVAQLGRPLLARMTCAKRRRACYAALFRHEPDILRTDRGMASRDAGDGLVTVCGGAESLVTFAHV